jgi:ppGpp synthetase/RelA/SpoT-type nucleotidyltranferase
MTFEEYEASGQKLYGDFANLIASILNNEIRDSGEFALLSIPARAKGVSSLKKKLLDKGPLNQTPIEDGAKDLAGCRVIFYTNNDIGKFRQSDILYRNFEIIWEKTKEHEPAHDDKDNPNQFRSTNFVVKIKPERSQLIEYRRFEGLQCEVQVQTILDHAWSEMDHDVGYKKPPTVAGYGRKSYDDIQRRMTEINQKYILPAGYHFAKIASDVKRISLGKELFDGDILKSIEKADNNNDRFDLIERLVKDVLPFYDDIPTEYPAILDALIGAWENAIKTKLVPHETPYGSFGGKEESTVTQIISEILRHYWPLEFRNTFKSIMTLFELEQGDESKKHLISVGRALCSHQHPSKDCFEEDRSWALSRLAEKASEPALFQFVMECAAQFLKPVGKRTTNTSETFTMHTWAVPANVALANARAKAIDILANLFNAQPDDQNYLAIISALLGAEEHPFQEGYSDELSEIILVDSIRVTELIMSFLPKMDFELCAVIEQRMLWIYRRNRILPPYMRENRRLVEIHRGLPTAILNFRDVLNGSNKFIDYKTLVGFESVFPPMWDTDGFQIEDEQAYRTHEIKQRVSKISDENWEYWRDLILLCASAKSSDGATFPPLREFLGLIGTEKPKYLLDWLQEGVQPPLVKLLSSIIPALCQSIAADEATGLVSAWVSEGRYLQEIAESYVDFIIFPQDAIRALKTKAIDLGDTDTCRSLIACAVRRYDMARAFNLEEIFLPCLDVITGAGDTVWPRYAWCKDEHENIFTDLSISQAEQILNALVPIPKVDFDIIRICSYIFVKHADLVIQWLGLRVAHTNSESDPNYEPIPHYLHDLKLHLGTKAVALASEIRTWRDEAGGNVRWYGSHLLERVFPEFNQDIESYLLTVLQSNDANALCFVVDLISAYGGKVFLHILFKELLVRDQSDSMRSTVTRLLYPTGIISGEFGMVESHRQTKEELQPWLTDEREAVRDFARVHILELDRSIAAETRRSEAQRAMRKLDYGEEI